MRKKVLVNRLQKLLDEHGVSQRKFAADIGVRSATINSLCNNSNLVSMNKEIAVKIMEYFNLTDFNELMEIVEIDIPFNFADFNKLSTEQLEKLREIIAEQLGTCSDKK